MYNLRIEENKIADLYRSGKSLKTIAIEFNISSTPIKRILKKNNIKIKASGMRKEIIRSRRFYVNQTFFKVIDREEKSYWVGFLAADGCVSLCKSKRPNRAIREVVSFSQAIKDEETIVRFNKDLDSSYPLVYKEKKMNGKIFKRVEARFYSKEIVKDLIDKGVVPRKSLILKPPKNIPNHLISHWIRGYFDGDGCITGSKGRCWVSILSTEEVLKWIIEKTNIKGFIKPKTGSKTYMLRIYSKSQVKKFAYYIYKEGTKRLERKYNKFKEFGVI